MKYYYLFFSCTDVFTSDFTGVEYLANGSYGGLVGILDRDEADVSIFGVRTDALPDEPVIYGTCYLPTEAALYSYKHDLETESLDTLDSVRNFDLLAYFEIFLCIYLTGFVMIAV